MPIHSSLLNKPRLVEKLRSFHNYVKKNNGEVGTKTRGIDLNFNKITTLPNDIWKLGSLRILSIVNNELKSGEITKAKQLLPDCEIIH